MVAIVDISMPELRSDLNKRALAVWNDKRGGALMPRHIDLLEVTSFIESVLILDVLADPLDFHYRFVGSRIDEFLSKPLTGRNMLDIPHQKPPSRIWTAMCKVVDTRAPVAGDVPYVGPKSDFIAMEDLIMPMSRDGQTVSHLIITADFFQPAPRKRPAIRLP